MFFLAFISLLATVLCGPVSVRQPAKVESGRVLGAATRRSSLLARSDDVGACVKNKAELYYAESHNNDGESNYAAKVTITSDKSILVLEELEHLLDDIVCAPTSITLSIPSLGDDSIMAALRELQDGHIITSHSRCNADFERQAYGVLDIVVADSSLIVFSVAPVPLNTAFHNIEIEMGYTKHAHELRSIGSLSRRDSTISKVSLNSISLIDKAILKDVGDLPIEISCKNCSLWGEIDMEFASFNWGGCNPLDNVPLSECVAGTATATAIGMGGIVELEVSVEKSWSDEIALLPASFFPSASVNILGIGTGTLQYGPFLDIGYNLKGNIDMSYGFEMQVPDGAKVVLDVADPSSSSSDGFHLTKVNTIPFKSSTKLKSLDLHASLRSQIAVSFDFSMVDAVEGNAEAGIYIETPLLKAQITPVTDVDVNCLPISSSNTGSQVFDEAIRIDLSSDWEFGYYLKGSVSVMGESDTFTPISMKKSIPGPKLLPNMCLEWDENTQSCETAEQAASNAATGVTAKGSAMGFLLSLTAVLFVIL